MAKSIKNLNPTNSKYTSGDYAIYKPRKYVGPVPIWYRSSYELRFMRIVEMNATVKAWSSENIQIPYDMVENGMTRRHTYNIDFTVWLHDGRSYIVEVKPAVQMPPKGATRLTPDQYKNKCKWAAACMYAKRTGYTAFVVVTEKELGTRIF